LKEIYETLAQAQFMNETKSIAIIIMIRKVVAFLYLFLFNLFICSEKWIRRNFNFCEKIFLKGKKVFSRKIRIFRFIYLAERHWRLLGGVV
jgi:hypothetical protein